IFFDWNRPRVRRFDQTLRSRAIVRRNDTNHHERRMRFFPPNRLIFLLEETIDDDRVLFRSSAPRKSSGFPIDYSCAGINRGETTVWKNDLACVWNPARIDSTMSGAQPNSGGAFVLA